MLVHPNIIPDPQHRCVGLTVIYGIFLTFRRSVRNILHNIVNPHNIVMNLDHFMLEIKLQMHLMALFDTTLNYALPRFIYHLVSQR